MLWELTVISFVLIVGMDVSNMIKNIIFDLGNVLVAFDYRRFYRSFGYDEAMVERLAKATALSPIWNELDRGALSFEEILQGFVENDPQLEAVIRNIFADVKELLYQYDYTISWIEQFKRKGYKVYYLSNFFQKAADDCAKEIEFLQDMDGGILSYQEKITKPEPEIYQLLLNRYGLKAEECVFLDDTEKNILGAEKEGIHGILFRNQEQAIEELRRLGVEL